jgi:hypothetical protein
VKIARFETDRRGDTTLLRAAVAPDQSSAPVELWFRFEGLDAPPDCISDPFVTAMLPSCMLDGEACFADGSLSAGLLRNLGAGQQLLARWYEFLTPVAVASSVSSPARSSRASGVACCFSGGVDSWFSLLRNSERVSHLLLVRGFDISLGNEPLWRAANTRAAGVARQMRKDLIICETNLRDVADRRRTVWGTQFDGDFWGRCLHGAALAACVQTLGSTIGELIVPATHSGPQLKPWGSSPALDHHWSNDRVTITHDGCEADRFGKVRAIAASDLALQSLRVCHNDCSRMNCGTCEKCVRTMLALRLCGSLERATTFPRAHAFVKLRRLSVAPHLRYHYETLLDQARRVEDREIAQAIEAILGQRFSTERSLAHAVRLLRRAYRGAASNRGISNRRFPKGIANAG